MEQNVSREELTRVGLEWLEQNYIASRDFFPKIFTEVSLNDYLTLSHLTEKLNLHEDRVYLKDISQKLGLPMTDVSPRVQRLTDRGLVNWKHDKNNTYITITDIGITAMKKQQERLVDFIEASVVNFGYERFVELAKLRGALNDTMEDIVTEF